MAFAIPSLLRARWFRVALAVTGSAAPAHPWQGLHPCLPQRKPRFGRDRSIAALRPAIPSAATVSCPGVCRALRCSDAALDRRRLPARRHREGGDRSEEHTSELQSLMRISYAVFCLKKKKHIKHNQTQE